MTIKVAAFYAEVPGKPSRFEEYLGYAKASQHALSATTPGARYVIITDPATAPKLEPHFEVAVLMSGERPLVLDGLYAQLAFVEQSGADLTVLPDIDCIANRDLADAIPAGVGMAITHRGPKFFYRINNCGYVRDHDLGAWFFRRAIQILEAMPIDAQEWWGDQEAWGFVVGLPSDERFDIPGFETIGDEILVARPDGRPIHVYPCRTHNCPMPDGGGIKASQINAFMVHFKGPRKEHLQRYMAERFGLT